MKLNVLVVFIFLLHSCRPNIVLNAISDVLYSGYQLLKCPLGNCCNKHWLTEDLNSKFEIHFTFPQSYVTILFISELQTLLRDEVFGQHIAADIVYRQMKAHLEAHQPSKPLVSNLFFFSDDSTPFTVCLFLIR
jgi:hypothetical protein